MAQVKYFLFCEDVLRDDAGKPTLVGIFDTIEVEKFPTRASSFKIAVSIQPDEGDFTEDGTVKATVDISDSDGKVQGKIEIEAKKRADSDKPVITTTLDISREFIIKSKKNYVFRLKVGNDVIASQTLTVEEPRNEPK